jgi:hypothetical protein
MDLGSKDLSLALRQWKRLGHTVEYASRKRRPFVVPVGRPQSGEGGSFELDKGTLSRVGADVRLVIQDDSTSDWIMNAQVMEKMGAMGLNREYLLERLFGIDYDPWMKEEWEEEQSMAQMMTNPKFVELIGIPSYLQNELKEMKDDPERLAMWQQFASRWDMIIVQPQMAQFLQQMQQMMAVPGNEVVPGGPPMGGGPSAPPMGGAPPVGQPGGSSGGIPGMGGSPSPPSLPPTTSGVSLPDFGRGPGSVSGQMGGPQGPVGPRPGSGLA